MSNKQKNKKKEIKPKNKVIKIRLNEDVYNQFIELKTLNKFATWQDVLIHLHDDKTSYKKVLVDETGYSLKIVNHLQKVGINLNQIAKIANKTGKIDDRELKEVNDFRREVIRVKNYFCKKVIPNFNVRSK
ncbi:plasmid mobilization relaxosome protein MobC [Moritella viscosa]|uniref:plasmid mobilization relaxosome protein MobC n=1 Tax=Moritella viscosa TaxID=80854 RepID=UPI00091064EE|nr:plasmid mobilization relaxosome protein MobC [Moritella viscosa]SHO07938.1 Putative mobC [Moritella viscosa]SHO08011.1 Putative mobC [Moritella viscosa]